MGIDTITIPGRNKSHVFMESREFWCFRLILVEESLLQLGRDSHESLDVLIYDLVFFINECQKFLL